MSPKNNLLDIHIIGDQVLRKKAEEVKSLDNVLKEYIDKLIKTMYEKDGIGLAAPQTGRSLRIFVVDPYWTLEGKEKNPKVFINPKFISFEGEGEGEEGCLSVPDIYEKVMRAKKVKIEAQDENFEKFTLEAEGFFARVIQHEYDHLEGILFIDKIPKLRKIFLKKKLKELEKKANANGVNIK
jgi:peptide deformylase